MRQREQNKNSQGAHRRGSEAGYACGGSTTPRRYREPQEGKVRRAVMEWDLVGPHNDLLISDTPPD